MKFSAYQPLEAHQTSHMCTNCFVSPIGCSAQDGCSHVGDGDAADNNILYVRYVHDIRPELKEYAFRIPVNNPDDDGPPNHHVLEMVKEHIDAIDERRCYFGFDSFQAMSHKNGGRDMTTKRLDKRRCYFGLDFFNDLEFSGRNGGGDMAIESLYIVDCGGSLLVRANYDINGRKWMCDLLELAKLAQNRIYPMWFQLQTDEYITGFRVVQRHSTGEMIGIVVVTNRNPEAVRYGWLDTSFGCSDTEIMAPPDMEVFALCGSMAAVPGMTFGFLARRRLEPVPI